jgi:hypothetical protein
VRRVGCCSWGPDGLGGRQLSVLRRVGFGELLGETGLLVVLVAGEVLRARCIAGRVR